MSTAPDIAIKIAHHNGVRESVPVAGRLSVGTGPVTSTVAPRISGTPSTMLQRMNWCEPAAIARGMVAVIAPPVVPDARTSGSEYITSRNRDVPDGKVNVMT